MIIVEGPDGAGKTTLVKKLLEDFPHSQIGARGTQNRKLLYTVTVDDTWRALRYEMAPAGYPSFVWDRLFFSEFVYAPLGVTPRPVEFNLTQQTTIQRLIQALQVPIVFCRPPLETVLETVRVEEQMDGVLENITRIYKEYDRMWRTGFMPMTQTFLYDFTSSNVGSQYGTIKNVYKRYLEEREARAA